MYYGNAAANSAQNASQAFLLYDTASVDHSSIFVCTSGVAATWTNGNYSIARTSSGGWNECDINGTAYEKQANVSFSATITSIGAGGVYGGLTVRNNQTIGKNYYRTAYFSSTLIRLSKFVSGAETHMAVGTIGAAVPMNVTLTSFGSNINATWISAGGTLKNTSIDTSLSNSGNFGFALYTDTGGATMLVKDIIGREYGYPEPTVTFGAEENSNGISIIQNYPADNYNSSSQTITFSCNATGIGSTTVSNMTLYITNGGTIINFTGGLSGSSNSTNWIMTKPDGNYNWSCFAGGNDGSSVWAATNRSFIIDSLKPTINITYPTNNLNITTFFPSTNITLNFTESDLHIQACWFYNESANITIASCGLNSSSNFTEGNHAIIYYANDTFGNLANASSSFFLNYIRPSMSIKSEVIEGESHVIYFNVTATNIYQANATVNYNGTLSSMDLIFGNSTFAQFSKTLVAPVTSEDLLMSINVSYYVNGVQNNAATQNQSVYPFYLALCNKTISQKTINFTFKDESNNAKINASLDASTWTYSFAGGSAAGSKTLLYSNLTNNDEYVFCIYPNWTTLSSNINFQYSNTESTVYPQRQWQRTSFSLSNTTDLETLYLLPSASGQYVTFQIINSALSPISDVTITASRTISGVPTIIETKVTDSSGAATMWLNPLYVHTITASKTGYITYSNSITPSSTSYTITLQQMAAVNTTNYNAGINYTIIPLDNYLNKSAYYIFNFTISSSGTLAINRFWYNITNNSGSIITSNYSSTDGGTLTSNISTGLNKSFTMFAYYDVNGTVISTSKMWLITNSSGDEWSIKYLINDLKAYTDTGIFGLDSFGITFIVFLIIFLGAGIISYNFGLYSPAAVSGIIFAETFLFDGVLGLIKYPFGVTLPMATIVMALVFFGLAVKEGTGY